MKGLDKRRTLTDGVSESIGFLLIFTLVIVGIGLVTLYGYPMLLQQQTSADEQIMQKNMIVLQNDIKSLAYKTVPYKETSLKIGQGSLIVYNWSHKPESSNITIFTDPANIYVDKFHSGDLRYYSESAGSEISLQNGAVVTRRLVEPGSVMLAEPRWFYDGPTNTVVINLINLTGPDGISRAGVGRVQMALGDVNYTKILIPAGTPIYLDFTPDSTLDYSVAWNNYFINTMKMTEQVPANNPFVPAITKTRRYELLDMVDATRDVTLVIKKINVDITSL